ncbi:MAG: NTP transferase domain-containing protein [Ignavibacteriaceae bacterium]|nr:NTP transferase domain-containing protein [Ignavibacteriaceae bacterium]
MSKRMGQPKPLLMYNNIPFVLGILVKLCSICSKVAVILGYKNEIVKEEIEFYLNSAESKIANPFREELKMKTILLSNPDYEKGMITSVKTGVNYFSQSDWLLYHLVDQPSIPLNFYKEFAQQIDDKYDWIQPSFNKTEGHPVIIKNSLIKFILDSNNQTSMKEISSRMSIRKKIWDCNYKEILQDIDTPQQYSNLE